MGASGIVIAEDAVDRLIDTLETAFPEIRWDRDALDTGAEEETGAVELSGEARTDWADGHPVDTIYKADIWICVNGSGLEQIPRMVDALLQFDDEVCMISWSQPERSYAYDIEKAVWRWVVHFWGPLYELEE